MARSSQTSRQDFNSKGRSSPLLSNPVLVLSHFGILGLFGPKEACRSGRIAVLTAHAENPEYVVQMQNSIREIFGSTFMLIEHTRALNLHPPGKRDAFDLLVELLPPVLEHCQTFSLKSQDRASGQVLLANEDDEAVIGICARDDGAFDLHIVSVWLNGTEQAIPVNMVLLKVLAYDC